MTTFDMAEVREFTNDVWSRMDQCDNGEGMQCANLDDTLRRYATLCREFHERVRQWGRAVFAGRVAFDPAVENLWKTEGWRLYVRARELLSAGYKAETEGPCYSLDGKHALELALWRLHEFLSEWVTPKLAVGPSARRGLPLEPADAEKVRQQVESLPPLPAGWQPDNERQRKWFRKLRTS